MPTSLARGNRTITERTHHERSSDTTHHRNYLLVHRGDPVAIRKPGAVGLAGLVRLVGVLPTAGVAPVALRLSALLPAALLPTALAVGLLRRVLARVVRAVLARILAGIVRFVLLSHGSTSRMPG